MNFGVPGVGKTPLIGEAERTLIIRPPTDHTDSIQVPENVREIVIKNWSDQIEAFQFVHQEGWEEFDSVWIDSLSGWQDFGLRDVLEDAVIRNPSKRGIEKGGQIIAEFGPDQPEYGVNFSRITNWVQDMCGLASEGKINFGITCHPAEWYNPVAEETILAPWIQGKGMISKICGYMNVITYMQEVQRENKPPQIQLLSSAPGFYGKDQYRAFPTLKSGKRGLLEPTMEKVLELFEAKRETPSEAVKRERDEAQRGPKKILPKKKAIKKKG
jgi:virulence-associated protein VagC